MGDKDTSTTNDFISKLDELLQKYDDLISMNHDREFLSLLTMQEAKISNLERKLGLAKSRLKHQTNLLQREKIEKEQLTESLKTLNQKIDVLSSSSSGFVTPQSHFSRSENDFENYDTVQLKKHCPNALTTSMFRFNSKNECPVTSRIGLGVSRLANRLNSTSFNKTHEPFSVFVNAASMNHTPIRSRIIDETDSAKLEKTFDRLIISKQSPLNTPINRRFGESSSPMKSKSDSDVRSISQFAPLIPPMIPSIVIHCIDEIEKRGLKEIGIYRMPGSEEEMITLREIFDAGDTGVNLSNINIHTVAHFLKTFLRNYPLIPKNFHSRFGEIISEYDRDELYLAIFSLPQPNRDTLAYLIVHLRRIALSVVCRMPASRLSVIFAQIIFGLHICDKENDELLNDQLIFVIEEFLKLPSSYWNSFIVEPSRSETPDKLRNSPSTEQIVRKKAKKYFTPPSRKKRFFTSPTFEQSK